MARIRGWLGLPTLALLLAACGSGGSGGGTAESTAEVKAAPPAPIQVPLPPSSIPQWVNQLPRLSGEKPLETAAPATAQLTIKMCEFDASVLPPGTPLTGNQNGATRVFGYAVGSCPSAGTIRNSYIGPVLVATRGTPTEINFVNELGTTSTTQVKAWKYSTDQTVHWADPLNGGANECHMAAEMNPGVLPAGDCAKNYSGPIPAVPHLHGGEVPPVLDGGPNAWFTSDGKYHGSGYYTGKNTGKNAAVFRYPNSQEPAPIWFHDHALGATRLNVYAGIAGAYVLQDAAGGTPVLAPSNGQQMPEIIPLVLQDRMFDTNGQLLFQAGDAGGTLWALNPEHPYWDPEFVGDTIVVNGKAWPNANVEPKRYQLLFLNGSNARTYELSLGGPSGPGPSFWLVATDGGYLDRPVQLGKLLMMPGERYLVIVDFGGTAGGTKLVVKNNARTPYPGGATPQGATLGQIVQFTVGACSSGKCAAADPSFNPAVAAATIRNAAKPMVRLVDFASGGALVAPARVRQLTLNEIAHDAPTTVASNGIYDGSAFPPGKTPATITYPGGPQQILLNNAKFDATTSETPPEGATEVWEIVNLTADAHPIHLHLVQFQVLNRQAFDANKYFAYYATLFPGGEFVPAFGPPLDYSSCGLDAGAAGQAVPGVAWPVPCVGGNPDVAPFLSAQAKPASPQEAGWKDTAMAPPGTVTRLMVRWAPTDVPAGQTGAYPFDPAANGFGYVWHCHIIDHEDNEMMRPTLVQAASGVNRTYVLRRDY